MAAASRYTLHEKLAEGGMGEVYLGSVMGPAGSREVALKRLRPSRTCSKAARARLIAEAKLVFQLTHGNICQVLDLGDSEEGTFIVMEYVRGVDLGALAKRGGKTLGLAHVLYVGREVARALDYAHRRTDEKGRSLALVHGDVTPRNILLSTEGEVKLADFGIAKALGGEAPGESLVGGTPGFVAPEAQTATPDHRADIYSLGMTMIRVLTYPERSSSRLGGDLKLASGEHVSKRLLEVLRRMTDPDPNQRYLSSAEAESELALELARLQPGYTPAELAKLVVACRHRTNPPMQESESRQLHSLVHTSAETVSTVPGIPADPLADVIKSRGIELSGIGSSTETRPDPVGTESHGIELSGIGRSTETLPDPVGTESSPQRAWWRRRRIWSAAALGLALTVLVSLNLMSKGSDSYVMPSQAMATADALVDDALVDDALVDDALVDEVPRQTVIVEAVPSTPVIDAGAQRSSVRRRGRKARRAKRPTASLPPATAVGAKLTVTSKPWGQVYIDGKRVSSETPLYKYELSAGAHRVKIFYPDLGEYSVPRSLRLKPGESRRIGFSR